METVIMPYHVGFLDLKIPSANLKGILYPKAAVYKTTKSQEEIIMEALRNPINSPTLRELAKGKHKIVLVTSDHTRAMPSRITLPLLLEEMRKGNPDADITILIATGLHRPTTKSEMINMFGQRIVEQEKILVHDAFNPEDMSFVCDLPSGNKFMVNKLALEADLLVCEGFIEPHFFAGYSGGRKSIFPGICSEEAVRRNHCYKAIAHPLAKTGALKGNPIHEDMILAAKAVKVAFILNVALDSKKKIINAFAGDLEGAHLQGCDFVASQAGAKKVVSDIVITSNGGYPLDQNLYQCPKAMATAAECVADGGVIVMVASCCDGVGGTEFEKLMLRGSPKEVVEALSQLPEEDTISEQWCAQILCDIMTKHQIVLVTQHFDHDIIRKMNIIPAASTQEAMDIAFKLKGRDATVTVIPDGVATMVS
jgi:nickel-dependent lactate racemase